MRSRRHVEQSAGSKFFNSSVFQGRSCPAGEYDSDVFDVTERRAGNWTYMLGPSPTRFVRGTTDRHATDVHNLEFSFLKETRFVGRLEPFQNHIEHSFDSFRIIKKTARDSALVGKT